MSTRATVLIQEPLTGEKAYLYHHCDGYELEPDLDTVLRNLENDDWSMKNVVKSIIDYDSAYGRHVVNNIGWDSEYVYVIDLTEKTLKKYACGLWFEKDHKNDGMSIADEKTQPKNLVRTFNYKILTESEREVAIRGFVETLKIVVNATAKNANISDSMKKEAIKRLYNEICR